ncbi:immunity protein SdpI [Lysinibacillus alkalisoli]|uniref:Immunity protein SdpI n=1 Tax=Lysinibacillus alkalisoli TaxID=1911548 RepID=A0A917LHY0_9BACI|nr:SdpI family protein [Lysinibacillus alkalisoli]GGG26457.1 immunity protein SdpI [Lysinibacillus alkalisoli]
MKLFSSLGIFFISIVLAIISQFKLDLSIPSNLTIVNGIIKPDLLIWILPLFILIVITSTFIFLRKSQSADSNKTVKHMTNFSSIMLLILQVIIISNSTNVNYDFNVVIGALVGLVTIVLANFMQKTKINLAYGLRLPWTLKDEGVWRKSNRFAAKLLMLAGLLILSFAFISPQSLEVIVLTSIGITAVISIIYSYIVSKQQTT